MDKTQLIAIPFDLYKSKQTNEGMVYNIATIDKVVYAQVWIAHNKYALHDVCIDNISGAPGIVKINLSQHLDGIFGKDKWKMKTLLSKKQVQQDSDLQNGFTYNENAMSIGYNNEEGDVITNNIYHLANYGIV